MRMLRMYMELAIGSLKRNRMRTFLTCLGVAIGVACIVLVLSLTGSVRRVLREQVNAIDAGLLVVRAKEVSENEGLIGKIIKKDQKKGMGASLEEVEGLRKLDKVKLVVPMMMKNEKMTGDRTENGVLMGTTSDLEKVQKLKMKNGTFLGEGSERNMAVLGREMALALFGTTQAAGKTMTVLDKQILVVGVLDEVNNPVNLEAGNFNRAVIVSVDCFKGLGVDLGVGQVSVKVEPEEIKTVAEEVKKQTLEWRGGEFEVVTGEDIIKGVDPTFKMMAEMLLLVAGVALLVGGIGVMNIMLVAVNERTREIGIRKAVGATGKNIVMQFLLESIILSLMGGVLGVALGHGISAAVAIMMNIEPFVSVETVGLTLVVALVVGVLFGVYPAGVAARKSSIGALKYYR